MYPLHSDIKRFEVTYHQPKKSIPKINGGSIRAHMAALEALPLMASFLKVVDVLDNGSPYLGYATNLVQQLQKSNISSIPAHIGNDKPEHVADVGGGNSSPAQKAPGPVVWGRPRVSFAKVVIEESTGDSSSQASTHFSDVTPMSGSGELCTHAHEQAAMGATRKEESDEEDLFGSSSDKMGSVM